MFLKFSEEKDTNKEKLVNALSEQINENYEKSSEICKRGLIEETIKKYCRDFNNYKISDCYKKEYLNRKYIVLNNNYDSDISLNENLSSYQIKITAKHIRGFFRKLFYNNMAENTKYDYMVNSFDLFDFIFQKNYYREIHIMELALKDKKVNDYIYNRLTKFRNELFEEIILNGVINGLFDINKTLQINKNTDFYKYLFSDTFINDENDLLVINNMCHKAGNFKQIFSDKFKEKRIEDLKKENKENDKAKNELEINYLLDSLNEIINNITTYLNNNYGKIDLLIETNEMKEFILNQFIKFSKMKSYNIVSNNTKNLIEILKLRLITALIINPKDEIITSNDLKNVYHDFLNEYFGIVFDKIESNEPKDIDEILKDIVRVDIVKIINKEMNGVVDSYEKAFKLKEIFNSKIVKLFNSNMIDSEIQLEIVAFGIDFYSGIFVDFSKGKSVSATHLLKAINSIK